MDYIAIIMYFYGVFCRIIGFYFGYRVAKKKYDKTKYTLYEP